MRHAGQLRRLMPVYQACCAHCQKVTEVAAETIKKAAKALRKQHKWSETADGWTCFRCKRDGPPPPPFTFD